MADQIVLMDQGTIMQQAAPEVIYHDPDNIFTAHVYRNASSQYPGTAGTGGLHRIQAGAGEVKRRQGKNASAAAERSLPGAAGGRSPV